MCYDCKAKYNVEKARASAGYADGTQISKIINISTESNNSSGHRGVYYEKKTNKFRARIKFQGKIVNLGSYTKFEDAVAAREEAEQTYFANYLEAVK